VPIGRRAGMIAPMADVPPQRPTIPVPSLVDEADRSEETALSRVAALPREQRPYLLFLGATVRPPFLIEADEVEIGRRPEAQLRIDDASVSRTHAFIRRTAQDTFILEDGGSANGTHVNEARVEGRAILRDGDRLQLGTVVLKFVLQDALDEAHQRSLYRAAGVAFPAVEAPTSTRRAALWSVDSWRGKPDAQRIAYDDPASVERVSERLRGLPPLVTSWEIEELKALIADAQDGKRFLLQGGDCAETFAECDPARIAAKLKILIQMSIVLIRGTRRPIIRVGRFAGQYAKPRSSPTEKRGDTELPSYFGDLVNRSAFTPEARRPDPHLLLDAYMHASLTLNFVRALSTGGFADLRRPEYFDLSYFERADLPPELSSDYQQICREIGEGLHFVRAFGDRSPDDLMNVKFYTSHEGLNLYYEAAQTRTVPRRSGHYDLTTHMPWIGERTRALDGAHIEFFRGIANPVAVKIGPKTDPEQAIDLCKVLNPRNEPGKILLVTRMGAQNVAAKLPPIIAAVERARRRVLWVSDPMHGNGVVTHRGTKTRNFDDILSEVEKTIDEHGRLGTYLGGVHFEVTGDDVTECIGGGLTEDDLERNYETLCDPRLNYRQAVQMAFRIGKRLSTLHRPSSMPPPKSV
jgi:3-deoxy-7-phosphoheptulonate synthase